MSLSNTRVIALLNRYFVPVYTSNEDYSETGSAPPEEKAELARIRQEGHAAKLSVGTVHAYVLTPDGHPLDSLHVAQAAQPQHLCAMLERAARTLGIRGGDPVIPPTPLAMPPVVPGALRLQLTARYLERKGEEYALIVDAGGNWSALPSVDWITLSREQWRKLLPPSTPRVGATWEVDRQVAATLLTHFYPPTENSDLSTNVIQAQALQGEVVSIQGEVARARLTGSLRMKHPFYHRKDENVARANVLGYMEFTRDRRHLRWLRLVTEEATYGSGASLQPYGVAVQSVP